MFLFRMIAAVTVILMAVTAKADPWFNYQYQGNYELRWIENDGVAPGSPTYQLFEVKYNKSDASLFINVVDKETQRSFVLTFKRTQWFGSDHVNLQTSTGETWQGLSHFDEEGNWVLTFRTGQGLLRPVAFETQGVEKCAQIRLSRIDEEAYNKYVRQYFVPKSEIQPPSTAPEVKTLVVNK